MQDTISQDPTNPVKLQEARDKIYNLVLYKGRTVRLLCCQKFATLNFSKGNFQGVARFEQLWRTGAIVILGAEVALTILDLIISVPTRVDAVANNNQIQSEFDKPVFDLLQIILALIVIYMLTVYRRFQDKVVKRDDPFSNANLLGLIIFMVVIQKYIIEAILTSLLNGQYYFTQNLLVTFRQTFFAIEVLFVQIPIRHNFSLDHVES